MLSFKSFLIICISMKYNVGCVVKGQDISLDFYSKIMLILAMLVGRNLNQSDSNLYQLIRQSWFD